MIKNKFLGPAVLLWTVCTMLPADAAEPRWYGGSQPAVRQQNPATSALLESAAADLEAGRLEQAAATLERAQRIEPGNAAILHYLGQVRLQQGNYPQAEALAARSNTLASGNRALQARNAWLATAARQAAAQDTPPAPKPAVDDERIALQRQLEEEIARRRHAEAQAASLRERLDAEQARGSRDAWAEEDWPAPAREERRPAIAPAGEFRVAALDTDYRGRIERIPRGHRPPPGLCRIWFPGRPPGKQPRPGDCHALRQRLPAGAWLIGH